MKWPAKGVYFFMEQGELRNESGIGLRVVRVGTHALTATSKTTLWNRLSQHKGSKSGGNHRGSIFRQLVGTTLLTEHPHCTTWEQIPTPVGVPREHEKELEKAVSQIIGAMPFLYVEIADPSMSNGLRSYIEQHSIALLSNFNKAPLDGPSNAWRGKQCDREKVRRSGLWNQDHVDKHYDPQFLDMFEVLIDKARNP